MRLCLSVALPLALVYQALIYKTFHSYTLPLDLWLCSAVHTYRTTFLLKLQFLVQRKARVTVRDCAAQSLICSIWGLLSPS